MTALGRVGLDRERRLANVGTPEGKRRKARAKEREFASEERDEREGPIRKKPESLVRKLLRSPPRRSGSDPG
jgi:hypothetical protein